MFRGCGFSLKGIDDLVNFCNAEVMQCCNGDFCNGDLPPKDVPPAVPLKCYKEVPGPYRKIDCDEEAMKEGVPKDTFKGAWECLTVEISNGAGEKATGR